MPDGEQRDAIDLAMRYYIAASIAWSMKITEYSWSIEHLAPKFGDDPRLSDCSVINHIRHDAKIRKTIVGALNIPPFWECAGQSLAQAEAIAAR